jgi:hypothetical protein
MIPPVKDQRDQPVLIPIDIEDYLYFWSPGLVTGCWVYAFYLAEGFHTVGTQAVNAIAGAPNARALLYAGEMASTRNLLESGESQAARSPAGTLTHSSVCLMQLRIFFLASSFP